MLLGVENYRTDKTGVAKSCNPQGMEYLYFLAFLASAAIVLNEEFSLTNSWKLRVLYISFTLCSLVIPKFPFSNFEWVEYTSNYLQYFSSLHNMVGEMLYYLLSLDCELVVVSTVTILLSLLYYISFC